MRGSLRTTLSASVPRAHSSSCWSMMHTETERKYELNTCCMSLFRWQKSIFACRSHLCFSKKRRRGRRTATGECTWRLREMPLTGTTWLTATGMNNTPCRAKQKLGSRNTTRENGTTGPESPGTEPGQCIFVSISSLLRFPVKRQQRTHFHGQLCSCFSLARTIAAVEKTTTTNLHINTSDMLLLKLPVLWTFQHFYIILMAMKTTTFP